LPPIPLGPPLPRRELIALLERMRKVIDQIIVQLKRDARPPRRRSRRTR
jgi:hypothetical protein